MPSVRLQSERRHACVYSLPDLGGRQHTPQIPRTLRVCRCDPHAPLDLNLLNSLSVSPALTIRVCAPVTCAPCDSKYFGITAPWSRQPIVIGIGIGIGVELGSGHSECPFPSTNRTPSPLCSLA